MVPLYESASLMEHGMVIRRFVKVQFVKPQVDSLQVDCLTYFWPCFHFSLLLLFFFAKLIFVMLKCNELSSVRVLNKM